MFVPLNAMSTGYLAASLQYSPAKIKKAAERLGIVPALTLNGIGHYRADDVDRLADALAGREPEATGEGGES